MIALAVGTSDLRLSFKFLDREKNGKLLIAVFADIFICRHNDLPNKKLRA
jgi:hypothetical protein